MSVPNENIVNEVASGKPPASFGMATATFVVVASMVGTGVLTTSGFTVYFVGSNQLMLILWVVGGIVALCGALTLAELSAALPRTGGDYVYLYEAYGPLIAFLTGWVSFLIGFGGPIAASAFAAAKYLVSPIDLGPNVEIYQRGLATLAIVILAAVHALTRKGSAGVQSSTTILKIVILVALAIAGLTAGWGNWQNLNDRPVLDSTRYLAMFFSLVYIYYAYTGWNAAAYLAGEIENPQRRLPRAILLGTGLVTVLYLALNIFFALALSASDVRGLVVEEGNLGPLAEIAQHAASAVFGMRVGGGISVAIGLTLLASLSAFVLTGPRVAYAMARAGQFPPIAGRLSKRAQTPAVATVLQSGWALVLLWTGTFEDILIYAGVGLAIFSMLTISSVYVLRVRRPDLPRPYRTPGYPVTPAIYLVMTGLLAGAVFYERPIPSFLSLASILIGIPAYYFWARKYRSVEEVEGI